MLKLRLALLIAICAFAAIASPVIAATLTHQSGEVLVNRGSGFMPLTVPAEVAPGTQIMVRPGASAFMRFANGCEIAIGPGRVWVVPDKPPCAEGRWTAEAKPAGDEPPGGPPAPVAGGGQWLLTPIIIAGGGAAAIILLTQGGGGGCHGKPASP